MKDLLISVTIVTQNDAQLISETLKEISTVLSSNFAYHEILIIDNCSNDDTVNTICLLQETYPNIRLIILSKEYDQEIAIAAGLDHSIGDFVVVMDHRTDPAHLIPKLIAKGQKGNDVIIGEKNGRDEYSYIEQWCISIFYKIYKKLTGFEISANAAHYRVLSRRAINSITQIKSKVRHLKQSNTLIGFTQAHFSYEPKKNIKKDKRKKHLGKLIFRSIDLIVSNSTSPLRLVSYMGLIASFVNFTYIGYIFIVALFKKEVAEGWLSTSIMNATMFFILFIILTVLSEYISRILIETKDQPLYFIREEYDSKLMEPHLKKINVV